MLVQHDAPVFLGQQQVREPCRAMRLAGGHHHSAIVAARVVLGAVKQAWWVQHDAL
ncbi:MAG: hypothetical protein ACRDRX_04720 [Pseudonocardiaceae bacterium]